ncbi:MAG: hypothetical protein ACYS9Y_00085 [Planctomycetota bacterium]|jgi:molecular chaperone GrpE (heat shock protein)
MWKQAIIFGLILLLTGSGTVGWALLEQRKEKQQLQEQLERLDGKLSHFDELISGDIDIQSFAKVLSVEDWHQKIYQYKAKKRTRDLTLNIGIACMLAGGGIFTWRLLLSTTRFVIFSISWLGRNTSNIFKKRGQTQAKKVKKSTKISAKAKKQALEQKKKQWWPWWHRDRFKKQVKAPEFSDWHNCSKEKIAVLYTDKESVELEKPLEPVTEEPDSSAEKPDKLTEHIRKTVLSDTGKKSSESEDLLKEQKDSLEKQMAEFKQMTETVQQTALEDSEPLSDSLKELTRQVSAIREYASQQQERVNKLQEGYDWNITRTFCLKIIRCIDNLEDRIFRLSKRDVDTTELEEIRDELIFALESSSVEHFKPEVKSNYRGQEKSAEPVKEREHCEDGELKGKIAKVIRPGYQYVIDEENVRVVRAARVKLFG